MADTASAVARTVELQYVIAAPTPQLNVSIIRVAALWHGIEPDAFRKIIEDTCKRVFCHLVIVDYDLEKPVSMMSPSSVLHLRIDYSSILNNNPCPNGRVSPVS